MYVSRADARYVVQYLWEVGGQLPPPPSQPDQLDH
jgi:hypothetical protein